MSNSIINVLVTGSRGSIVQHIKKFNYNSKVKYHDLDIINNHDALNIEDNINFSKYDFCLHFGATSSRDENNFSKIFKNNIHYSEILISKIKNYPNCKFIFASANSIISENTHKIINCDTRPSPKDFYSLSKLLVEELISNYLDDSQYLIIRMPAIYGVKKKSNGLINIMNKKILNDSKIHISNKNFKFNNATLIENFADFIRNLIEKNTIFTEKKITIGAKDSVTLSNIFNILSLHHKSKSKLILEDESTFKGYIVDINAAEKMGYKAPLMNEVINSVIKN